MTSRFRVRPIDLMVLLAIVGFTTYKRVTRPPQAPTDTSAFAQRVQLNALDSMAVQADGRLRSFASHAKTYMGIVTGPRSIHGQSNGFTYLDLIFRTDRYDDVDLIYVKNKSVRTQILDALEDHPDVDDARAATILKRGLISRNLLMQPQVTGLLQRLGQDLIRTAKSVDAIQSAMNVSDGRFLLDVLRMIPPPGADVNQPWISMAALASSGAPSDHAHAGLHGTAPIPGLDPALQETISEAWSALREAWVREDAVAVNAQAARLAAIASTVAPSAYPATDRLAMESWYFRNKSMTWVWLLYLACVIPLLMSVVYKWDRARTVGMILFVLAFGFHTASVALRWYISGRWPNANMFEAVTTAAWFGGLGALVLEGLVRRTAFRNLFALGSSVMSMVALMVGYFLPAELDSGISNKMAALNDIWLYIHTNMIIWSYAVIGLACVPALLQLRHRWCQLWDSNVVAKPRLLILPLAVVALNYTGYRLLMHALDDPVRELSMNGLIATSGAFFGSLLIVMLELNAAWVRRQAGIQVDRAASGGASSLIMGPSTGASFLKQEQPTATQVYDGATMVLVELAFFMLWTGTVMGAIWADHSWGRPWGWDPKEVFALNTFIIFIVLIHVRLKVKDRAFWTAVLAVVGFEVMMFNWIVVNFIIVGLHSYA